MCVIFEGNSQEFFTVVVPPFIDDFLFNTDIFRAWVSIVYGGHNPPCVFLQGVLLLGLSGSGLVLEAGYFHDLVE